MRFLWAPWRMKYILERKREGCIFCEKPVEGKDRKNLILHRATYAFVMMNRFPYNNGHVMVVPNRHSFGIEELGTEEATEVFALLKLTIRVLKKVLHPHGFNVGINIGMAAGAGEDHIHIHVVPRWNGDTNFMPILGEAKVVPHYLEETFRTLYGAFKNLSKKNVRQKGIKRL